ncbi:MAG: C40 family peptidase, partial [Actinobacteria bacterium]|nr:C40 family peptidase [Actinomycetota bacterium]
MVTAAVLSVSLLITLLPGASRAANFPDIANQPADVQAAINYAADNGYMSGAPDGNFYPGDAVARIDYAQALVKLFRRQSEGIDPGISFTDIKSTDPEFKYANLAVKHGYLTGFGDGSFRSRDPVTTQIALTGLVMGLKMDDQVKYLNGLYPRGPPYQGYLIVAHDLHLKIKGTQTWPGDNYPRGEMAYSLQKLDQLDDWRVDYIKESFDWLHCQTPWMGTKREKALDSAFVKIGAPYVWGGESDAERGYDCSGLTYYVLSTVLGYPMMRSADDQARDKRYATISRKELLAGDPIFFYKDATNDTSAPVGHAGMYIGQGLFIHSTGSNAGVSVDRLTGYWDEKFAWGKRVIGEPEPETFDTYILLANPKDEKAEARLTYMLPGGKTFNEDVELEPNSRKTVKVDDMLVNQEVSTTVEATRGEVIPERSMYFRYRGLFPGGHDSPGVTAPAEEWYLPEGCTTWGFDTFILVQNPGDEAANVTVTFMKSDGTTADETFTVQPYSRYTVAVDLLPGLEQTEFSARVTADRPVVAERSMYFDYRGIREGHNSPGVTALSNDWYFAEGCTNYGFDTYFLLMNPSDMPADVTLTLLDNHGLRGEIPFRVGPHARYTVIADEIKGWEKREFSALVRSPDVKIAVERTMYFDYNGIMGGHDALGSVGPRTEWYLAEGYTAQGFDTFILLSNPGDTDAKVDIRYLLSKGRYIDRSYMVIAHSRYTIPVDSEEGLSAEEVSSSIKSSEPILVERSMYFRYG